VGVDRQPSSLSEVEHVLVVQVAVEWTNGVRSGQELARDIGCGRKCRVCRGKLKERLEPSFQRVQLRKWPVPRFMQPSGCAA
jgi:bacterioferritin-associated ferredoxin